MNTAGMVGIGVGALALAGAHAYTASLGDDTALMKPKENSTTPGGAFTLTPQGVAAFGVPSAIIAAGGIGGIAAATVGATSGAKAGLATAGVGVALLLGSSLGSLGALIANRS